MQWHLDHRHGAQLTAVPFDVDDRWIATWLDGLADVPGLVQIRSGDYRGYDDMPYYAIADGRHLVPEDLALGRPRLTEQAFAAYPHLTGSDIPRRLQVSIPNALDLSYFASGSVDAATHWMPTMQSMVSGEVSTLSEQWGDRILLQLESPAILLAYHSTPRQDWSLLTSELVRQVSGVLGAAPYADWVLHLCYGDLEHTPLFEPTDLTAATMFLNALSDQLADRGQRMPTVHLPLTHGDAAPPVDPLFYAHLRRLRRGIPIIAGLVAEEHPHQTSVASELLVGALGVPVEAISAACGLGRRSETAGKANTLLAATVALGWNERAAS
ncbi:hypothetical protein HUW46_09344 [Amycolatopsis sp. CA-230715]|nr:hypothetical protein HUW46_09344 [Amycolatopsis sp. CA-230715]